MTDVVIVGAARTPVAAFNGSLGSVPAHELGVVAIKAALDPAGVDAAEIAEVIMGHVLTAGAGQNTARQAAYRPRIPVERPASRRTTVFGPGRPVARRVGNQWVN